MRETGKGMERAREGKRERVGGEGAGLDVEREGEKERFRERE